MKGGLPVLAKFKAFTSDDDGTCEQPLPSWITDLRLANKLFKRDIPSEAVNNCLPKIKKTWEAMIAFNPVVPNSPSKSLIPQPPPVEQQQFFENNGIETLPCTQNHSSW
jgi:hypothetical protein